MSTYHLCIHKLENQKKIDCSSLHDFITQWKMMKIGELYQKRQTENLLREQFLHEQILEPIILNIIQNIGQENNEDIIYDIYDAYDELHFEGGSVTFLRDIEKIGTAVSHYSLSRGLVSSNEDFFKSNRIEDYIDELLSGEIKSYHTEVNGRIKTSNAIWMTWSYETIDNPFFFLEKIDFLEKKSYLINQLGLVKRHYATEKCYLISFNENYLSLLHRATICDAGNNEYYKVSDREEHGFSLSHDYQELEGEIDSMRYGRPEAILKTEEVDINNAINMISL